LILYFPIPMKPTSNRSSQVIRIAATADKSTLMTVKWKPVSHGHPGQRWVLSSKHLTSP
jgi:hypothetical protein